jgi:hypothetical protein
MEMKTPLPPSFKTDRDIKDADVIGTQIEDVIFKLTSGEKTPIEGKLHLQCLISETTETLHWVQTMDN